MANLSILRCPNCRALWETSEHKCPYCRAVFVYDDVEAKKEPVKPWTGKQMLNDLARAIANSGGSIYE